MRIRMIHSSFLFICLFAMSEQCACPVQFTQAIVCFDRIVVEATIESFAEKSYDTNYQISVTKFYKGKGEYDTLSDKTTLKTPKHSAACGPVVLKVGTSYILSVSAYDGKMQHNLCGLQVEASSATNTLLNGIAGKYQENCDCKIPTMYELPHFGPRNNNECGYSARGCNGLDSICARDGNGQCNWQNC